MEICNRLYLSSRICNAGKMVGALFIVIGWTNSLKCYYWLWDFLSNIARILGQFRAENLKLAFSSDISLSHSADCSVVPLVLKRFLPNKTVTGGNGFFSDVAGKDFQGHPRRRSSVRVAGLLERKVTSDTILWERQREWQAIGYLLCGLRTGSYRSKWRVLCHWQLLPWLQASCGALEFNRKEDKKYVPWESTGFPISFQVWACALPLWNLFPGFSRFIWPHPFWSFSQIFPGFALPLSGHHVGSHCACLSVLLHHLASIAHVLSKRNSPLQFSPSPIDPAEGCWLLPGVTIPFVPSSFVDYLTNCPR